MSLLVNMSSSAADASMSRDGWKGMNWDVVGTLVDDVGVVAIEDAGVEEAELVSVSLLAMELARRRCFFFFFFF